MRLHRLVVQAFGPFAEQVEVDLDALGEAGIFLVQGPTGAGKTSLLDAVCYALYAAVPGGRSPRALRSDHAERADLPQVSLELTLDGRRLRVTRSPEHARPKKRGPGQTLVPPKVLLEERTGAQWQALSTRADETGDLLGRLLGMGLEQFAKVVLLPQGDFAAFLRANADERRALLERLFDISRYADIEGWLVEQRRMAQATVTALASAQSADGARVDDVLARLPDEVGVEVAGDEALAWAGLAPGPLAGALESLGDRLAGMAGAALAARAAAEEAHEAAETALRRDEALAAGHARATAARAAIAELAGRQEALTAAERRVDAAERAAGVAGDLRALDVAVTERRQAARAAAAARQPLGGPLELAGGDLRRLAALVGEHDDDVAEMERLAVAVARRASALDDARQQHEQHEQARRQVGRAAEAAVARHEAAIARLAELDAELSDAPEAQAMAAQLHESHRRRVELDLAHDRLAEATQVAALAVEHALQLRERLLDLRQRRLDGIAAELAAGLADGSPCPVCGSPAHPAPALDTDPVTAEELDAAGQAWEAQRSIAERAGAEVAAARELVTTRSADLGGETRDATTLQTTLAAAKAEAERLTLLEARRSARLAEVESCASAVTAAGRAAVESDRRLEALAARLAALAEEAEAEASALAEASGRHTGCGCAGDAAAHRRVTTELAAAVRADDRLAEAESRLTAVVSDAESVCRAAGLEDAGAARTALLPHAELTELRRLLTEADRRRTTALATLADPEVRAAEAGPLPDLEAGRRAVAAVRAARSATVERHTVVEQAALAVRSVAADLLTRSAQLAAASERAAALSRLADTVTGLGPDNTRRMRLSAYVLAGRLERVVELANERLARLGDGRYRLRHDDTVAGRGRSGLGLRVLDLWTGLERETTTLSGGESFMASLALALGLADAVREESGGLELQTLFVDEGFGSLDDDSLEQVLAVLDGLRDGGRAVGVVSHVADLRARI
ncbi:MAG TPA: SMC family ATPase, partial [Dermatophilaceae bacterium]|nr:SMC family ATPase [Dermatophilaceae bacterium]